MEDFAVPLVSVVVVVPVAAVLHFELPPAVPLGGEDHRNLAQQHLVGHVGGGAFHDDVDAGVPAVRAGGQDDLGMNGEVPELLFSGSGVEEERAVIPGCDERGDDLDVSFLRSSLDDAVECLIIGGAAVGIGGGVGSAS